MSIIRTRDARQSVTVTTPPDYDANLPCTVQELKTYLRLGSGTAEDDLLKELEIQAIEWIESAARRYLTPQAITVTLDHFPCQKSNRTGLASQGINPSPQPDCSIVWQKLPIQSVDEIRYTMSDDTTQILATDQYVLDNASDRKPSRIFEDPTGSGWPTGLREFNSVQIDMQVGYANGEIPPVLKSAILKLTAKLYTNRGDCCDDCAEDAGIMKMLGSMQVALF